MQSTHPTGLFDLLNGRDLSHLTNKEISDLGEEIAKRFLGDNGYTDIISIQDASNNGIDIVTRSADGCLSFFEVKSFRVGKVGQLSARQRSMSTFVEDVLRQEATGTGRYRDFGAAAQDTAQRLLREFLRNPLNVSGNAVGVDLLNEIVRVSPWR